MTRSAFFALAALAGLLLGSPAHANPLAPGGTATPDTLASLSGLTYVTKDSGTLNNLSSPGGTIDATYQEWVYKDAGGHLTFLYQVDNLSNSDYLAQIGVSSFKYASTDVGVYTGSVSSLSPAGVSGGTAPSTVGRTSGLGSTINFNFTTDVAPGHYSAILYVATSAVTTQPGTITLQDDSSTFKADLGPTTPEPSSMVLVGLGAMGFFGYGIRRRKARVA